MSDWIERCEVVQILLATRWGAAGTSVDLARRHQQPTLDEETFALAQLRVTLMMITPERLPTRVLIAMDEVESAALTVLMRALQVIIEAWSERRAEVERSTIAALTRLGPPTP